MLNHPLIKEMEELKVEGENLFVNGVHKIFSQRLLCPNSKSQVELIQLMEEIASVASNSLIN